MYVAARPFTSFGGELMQRLPAQAKSLLVDAGICHYMAIVREPSGKLFMFDFGPIGGDVHVHLTPSFQPDRRPAALRGDCGTSKKGDRKSVCGEVRMSQVRQLPATLCVMVSRSFVSGHGEHACMHACRADCRLHTRINRPTTLLHLPPKLKLILSRTHVEPFAAGVPTRDLHVCRHNAHEHQGHKEYQRGAKQDVRTQRQ
jgi:hypothetical protein